MSVFARECEALGWLPTGDEIEGVPIHNCTPIPGRDDCLMYPNTGSYYLYWGPSDFGNPSYIIVMLYLYTTIVFVCTIFLVGAGGIWQQRGLPKSSHFFADDDVEV